MSPTKTSPVAATDYEKAVANDVPHETKVTEEPKPTQEEPADTMDKSLLTTICFKFSNVVTSCFEAASVTGTMTFQVKRNQETGTMSLSSDLGNQDVSGGMNFQEKEYKIQGKMVPIVILGGDTEDEKKTEETNSKNWMLQVGLKYAEDSSSFIPVEGMDDDELVSELSSDLAFDSETQVKLFRRGCAEKKTLLTLALTAALDENVDVDDASKETPETTVEETPETKQVMEETKEVETDAETKPEDKATEEPAESLGTQPEEPEDAATAGSPEKSSETEDKNPTPPKKQKVEEAPEIMSEASSSVQEK